MRTWGTKYPVIVILYLFKHARRDPLSGFPQVIARKHPVNVRIIHRPEPLSDIHGMVVHRRYHQNLLSRSDGMGGFQFLQLLHKLRAHIELLYLISADASHNTGRLLPVPKTVSADFQRLPAGRFHRKNFCFSHAPFPPVICGIGRAVHRSAWRPPRIRPRSDPL